jgi:SAM-dependent methyltransferase
MAGVYDAGRSLSEAAMASWEAAAGPHLRGLGAGVVVDLGAGTGRFSGHLARWAGRGVVAVEPAVAMAARARAKGMGGVTVAVGSAEAIPLADGRAAAVWMSQVVHHIGDLDRAAAELGRVVRPGGRLLIRGEFGPEGAEPTGPGDTGGTGASETGTSGGLASEDPAAHRPDFAVYRYFPAAGRLSLGFPTRRRVLAALGGAGFALEVGTRVRQQVAADLLELHARLATRADSTLAAIGDDEFATGLDALARAARAEADGDRPPAPVVDTLHLTVLRRSG